MKYVVYVDDLNGLLTLSTDQSGMRLIWVIIGVMTFMACSGGGGGVVGNDGIDPVPPDPGAPPGSGITDPSMLPTTGRARYDGTLNLALGDAVVSSDLGIEVDFGATAAQVTGQAEAFAGMDGAVFFTLGEIDRTPADDAPTVTGTVSGTLKAGDTSRIVFGNFEADFSGTGQQAIRGAVAGSVIVNAVQSGMSGTFQAGRAP